MAAAVMRGWGGAPRVGGGSAAPAPLCFAPSGAARVPANHNARGRGRKGGLPMAARGVKRRAPPLVMDNERQPISTRLAPTATPTARGAAEPWGKGETSLARGGDRWGRRWTAALPNQRPARYGHPSNRRPALRGRIQSETARGGPCCRRGGGETVDVGGDE